MEIYSKDVLFPKFIPLQIRVENKKIELEKADKYFSKLRALIGTCVELKVQIINAEQKVNEQIYESNQQLEKERLTYFISQQKDLQKATVEYYTSKLKRFYFQKLVLQYDFKIIKKHVDTLSTVALMIEENKFVVDIKKFFISPLSLLKTDEIEIPRKTLMKKLNNDLYYSKQQYDLMFTKYLTMTNPRTKILKRIFNDVQVKKDSTNENKIIFSEEALELFSNWFWDYRAPYWEDLKRLLFQPIESRLIMNELRVIRKRIIKDNRVGFKGSDEILDILIQSVAFPRIYYRTQPPSFDYEKYYANCQKIKEKYKNNGHWDGQFRHLIEMCNELNLMTIPIHIFKKIDEIVSGVPSAIHSTPDGDELLQHVAWIICNSDLCCQRDLCDILLNCSPYTKSIGKICYSATVFDLAIKLILLCTD